MIDWSELFGFSVSPIELVIRGSCVYWLLFLLFRFVVRRDVGAVGIADILVLRTRSRCRAERDGR